MADTACIDLIRALHRIIGSCRPIRSCRGERGSEATGRSPGERGRYAMWASVGGRTGHARDHDSPPVEIDAGVRGRGVVFIVAKHELSPASIDRVPRAGVKHRLEFIEARRRGGPAAVAIPGKPASAVQPQAQPVQGGQRDQADSQAGDGHEEQHSHAWLTHGAVWRVPMAAESPKKPLVAAPAAVRPACRDQAVPGRVNTCAAPVPWW